LIHWFILGIEEHTRILPFEKSDWFGAAANGVIAPQLKGGFVRVVKQATFRDFEDFAKAMREHDPKIDKDDIDAFLKAEKNLRVVY
jgi:hypothetical protein